MRNMLLICCFFLSACNETAYPNAAAIVGNWAGASWLVEGKDGIRNASETFFSFDGKGNYSFDYAGTRQTGTYKVENDMLFTTPAGEREIMVKITKLNSDSLQFEMNRGGQREELLLIKK